MISLKMNNNLINLPAERKNLFFLPLSKVAFRLLQAGGPAQHPIMDEEHSGELRKVRNSLKNSQSTKNQSILTPYHHGKKNQLLFTKILSKTGTKNKKERCSSQIRQL